MLTEHEPLQYRKTDKRVAVNLDCFSFHLLLAMGQRHRGFADKAIIRAVDYAEHKHL